MTKNQNLFAIGSLILLNSCHSVDRQNPNIIFILADDMGYGDVSALNENAKLTTPYIDQIANNGVVFTDAHSGSAVSTPTRYGILTGRYSWRSPLKEGVLYGYDKELIPPERTTIASILDHQRYETGCIGKWHLGWTWNNVDKGQDSINYGKPITGGPTSLGFDYFYGIVASLDMPPYVYVENDLPTAKPNRLTSDTGMKFWREGPTAANFEHQETLPHLVDKAVGYINQKANGANPFFLYLPLPAPHTPILPSKDFQGKSGLNAYGDFVLEVDAMVGRIIDALKKNGIEGNTILVFASDNGCSPAARIEELQEQGHYPSYIYRGHKADLFEGGHRIPFVAQWPEKIKPHTITQTVCLTDFVATFAALTGYVLKDNEGEDSYNILPLLLNQSEDTVIREATVHHSINGEFSLRKGKWKLLLSPSSGGWSYPRPGTDTAVIRTLPQVQLYDIHADPEETQNVYAAHPDIVTELKNLLAQYIRNGRSTPGVAQKNDGDDPWKQLDWMNNL
jgi:arylsulfatase A-like enzyme